MSSAPPESLDMDLELIRQILMTDTNPSHLQVPIEGATVSASNPNIVRPFCPYPTTTPETSGGGGGGGLNNNEPYSPSSSGVPSGHINLNVNLPMDMDMQPEGGPAASRKEIDKDLIFSPYYTVRRHSRALRRSEVLGLAFVTICVICIALEAQVGLEALGYINVNVNDASPESQSPYEAHQAHTFSWKILSEFFISESVSGYDKDCLYFNKKRMMFRRRGLKPNVIAKKAGGGGEDDEFTDNMDEYLDKLARIALDEHWENSTTQHISEHVSKCPETRIPDAWTWLCKFMASMLLPILNLVTTLILLIFITCRRKKGIQFALMIPAFLCVFLDIFQQVPMVFNYSYTGIMLAEDMQNSLVNTFPPMLVSPIWEETQIHGHCCGIHSPETWTLPGYDGYPRSCCNYASYNCNGEGYPTKSQIWTEGCYKHEYDKVRNYEFYAVMILLLKLFAEMGILWSLSDLSRYDYPRPEYLQTSSCTIKDFEVRTFGCARILGVTDQPKMAIKLNNFKPGKYRFATSQAGPVKTIAIKTVFKTTGSIEIRRQARNHNMENVPLDFNRGQQYGLIFLTF